MKIDIDELFKFAFKNDVEGVESVLASGIGPDVKHPKAGHTPLQVACEAGADAAASVLLRAGANPNLRFTKVSLVSGAEYANRVALMYASSPSTIQILLQAGADIDAADKDGWTPLSIAAENGNLEAVKALLQNGARRELFGAVLKKYGSFGALLDEKSAHLSLLASKGKSQRIDALMEDNEKVRDLLSS